MTTTELLAAKRDRLLELGAATIYEAQGQRGAVSAAIKPIDPGMTLAGKILCAASGTTSADYVKADYKGKITLRVVPTWSECVRDLAVGDVDAVSTDDLVLAGFAAEPQYKGLLKVVG